MSRPNLEFFGFFFIFESLRDFVCVCLAVLFVMFWIFIRYCWGCVCIKVFCSSAPLSVSRCAPDSSPCARCRRAGPLRLTAFGTLPLYAVQPGTSPSVSFADSSPARVRAYKEWIRMGPASSPSSWDKAGPFYAHFNPYILGSHACGGAGAAKGRV